ncbi:hypothetical protein SC499_12120 [Peribacillus simplex]|nr:hypothetical protein [Peribacillus simplex]MDW7615448.1 hypothetical protein [Peribacillus simplex]
MKEPNATPKSLNKKTLKLLTLFAQYLLTEQKSSKQVEEHQTLLL